MACGRGPLVRPGAGPRRRPAAPTIAAIDVLDLRLGERPVGGTRAGRGRPGSSRRPAAARRGRCRTGARPAGAAPACARDERLDGGGGMASGTTIARSRSTSGNRATGAARSGARRPAARPVEGDLGDDRPARPVRSSHASTTSGWTSPTSAYRRRRRSPPRGCDPDGGPARRPPRLYDGAGRGRAVARAARGDPSRRRGRTGAGGRFQAGALARRRRARARAATTRAARRRPRRSPCRSRTPPRPRARAAGSCRRRRAGCRAGSGGAASGRAKAGCVTPIGSRPGCGSSPTDGTSGASANVSTWRGETRAWVTTSVRPAPASVSRTSSRASSGDGRKAGIAVSGVTEGTSS